MKRLASIILIVASIMPPDAGAECELKVRFNLEPPGFVMVDGKLGGLSVELLDLLLREVNCQAKFVLMPWKRSLLEVKSGNINLIMNANYTAERAIYLHYLWTQTYETGALITKKEVDFRINSLEDMKKIPGYIGLTLGADGGPAFTEKYNADSDFRALFFMVAIGKNIMEMVNLDRIGGGIISLEAMRYHQKQSRYTDMLIHPLRVDRNATFLGLSKKSVSTELLIRFHEANARVIANGGYHDVIKKWYGE